MADDKGLRLLPPHIGYGFSTKEPLEPWQASQYRYEKVGIYHNYYFKKGENIYLPVDWASRYNLIIDGFSPNMNKELHIGHLRNLAVAASLQKLLVNSNKFVALLGCSLGVKKSSLEGYNKWCKFVGYTPTIYYDVALPQDVVQTRPGPDGCLVWDGPQGEVIVARKDGSRLYSFYDLAFADYVGPDHYITGHEQIEHFQKLGLGDKHLPMGLVLGSDGKKAKSRDGNAFMAEDAIKAIKANIWGEMDSMLKERLAWNILVWNFLSCNRASDIRFSPEEWTRTESLGMFISYTVARLNSAYRACGGYDESKVVLANMEDESFEIWSMLAYYDYYLNMAMERMDPAPVAQYAIELAKFLSKMYEKKSIKDGSNDFIDAIYNAMTTLEHIMENLTMFPMREIR